MSKPNLKALPKWPQMLVYGKDVTMDQATEIIRRTDYFIHSHGMSGNNRAFREQVCKGLGLPLHDYKPETDWRSIWEAWGAFKERIGFIETSYVHNDWMSSAYIYGPHGWCDPMGRIFHSDNVGKWPSFEELVEDWTRLAQAFPFLDLDVALMAGESCEESELAGCIEVRNGTAALRGYDFPVFERFGETLKEVQAHAAGFKRGRGVRSLWSHDAENFAPAEYILKTMFKDITEGNSQSKQEAA